MCPFSTSLYCSWGTKKFFPDFLVLNTRTRKEYYWEHYGKMDDPQYASRSVWKIKTYSSYGYIIGHPMIYTFEAKNYPLSMSQVLYLIEKYLK